MKQRITLEQLKELNQEQQNNLRSWWKPQIGDLFGFDTYINEQLFDTEDMDYIEIFNKEIKPKSLPLLSIGQCIEYIIGISESICLETTDYDFTESRVGTCIEDLLKDNLMGCEYELIDALWEAVKESL